MIFYCAVAYSLNRNRATHQNLQCYCTSLWLPQAAEPLEPRPSVSPALFGHNGPPASLILPTFHSNLMIDPLTFWQLLPPKMAAFENHSRINRSILVLLFRSHSRACRVATWLTRARIDLISECSQSGRSLPRYSLSFMNTFHFARTDLLFQHKQLGYRSSITGSCQSRRYLR